MALGQALSFGRRPANTVGNQVKKLVGGHSLIVMSYGSGKYLALTVLIDPDARLRSLWFVLGAIVSMGKYGCTFGDS